MALPLSKSLGFLSLAVAAIFYLGAVAGVFFAAATPPLDPGALSVLIVAGLFGLLALLLDRKPVT